MPGVFQTCAVSRSIASIENSRTAKKETDGPAGVATAPWTQPFRLRSVLLCSGYCALQLSLSQLLIGHWKVSCFAGAHQCCRLDYLQGQGHLMRPPRGPIRPGLAWWLSLGAGSVPGSPRMELSLRLTRRRPVRHRYYGTGSDPGPSSMA